MSAPIWVHPLSCCTWGICQRSVRFVCCLFRWKHSSAGSNFTSSKSGGGNSETKRRRISRSKTEDDILQNSVDEDVKPHKIFHAVCFRSTGRPRGLPVRRRIPQLPPATSGTSATASSHEMAEKEANKNAELEQTSLLKTSGSFDDQWEKDALRFSSSGIDGANLFHFGDLRLSTVEIDHAYAKSAPATPEGSEVSKPGSDDGGEGVVARQRILNSGSSDWLRSSGCNHACPTPPPTLQRCTVVLNRLNNSVFDQQPKKLDFHLHSRERTATAEGSTTVEKSDPHLSCGAAVFCTIDGQLPSTGADVPIGNVACLIDVSDISDNFTFGGSCEARTRRRTENPTSRTSGLDQLATGAAWEDRQLATASSTSVSSGLDVLASVSSLTADRLRKATTVNSEMADHVHAHHLDHPLEHYPQADCLEAQQPLAHHPETNHLQAHCPQADHLQADYTQAHHPQAHCPQADHLQADCAHADHPEANHLQADYTQAVRPHTDPHHCHVTTRSSEKRRVTVFCIRKRCPANDPGSQEGGPPPELLDLVRGYVAKGGSGPECGTLASRNAATDQRQLSVSRRSEEIACNSLLLMHSSCSTLQNGLTEPV